MDIVKVGIVGVGNIGTVHAKCIYNNEIKGLKLSALCDISKERLEYLKNEFPDVNNYSNYFDMVSNEELDAVIISTPHKFHSEMAEMALEKGLNVLVEKPIDITVTKARRLNEKAEKSKKSFAIMFNQRTNPLYIRAREIVQGGKLGELKRTNWIITNWYRTQKYYDSGSWRATWSGEGGGVLLNQAPHNLDLWQWICGMPSEITAFCDCGKYHNIDVEDDVTIFVRYKNGATGTFITTTGEYPGTNRLEISGDRGKIVIENGVLKWWELSHSEREYCFDKISDDISYEYSEIKQESPEPAHKGILQNFANAILYGEELIATGFEGIKELSISNAAYLSQWNGNTTVKVPFNSDKFDALLLNKINNYENKKIKGKQENSNEYLKRWYTNW